MTEIEKKASIKTFQNRRMYDIILQSPYLKNPHLHFDGLLDDIAYNMFFKEPPKFSLKESLRLNPKLVERR